MITGKIFPFVSVFCFSLPLLYINNWLGLPLRNERGARGEMRLSIYLGRSWPSLLLFPFNLITLPVLLGCSVSYGSALKPRCFSKTPFTNSLRAFPWPGQAADGWVLLLTLSHKVQVLEVSVMTSLSHTAEILFLVAFMRKALKCSINRHEESVQRLGNGRKVR